MHKPINAAAWAGGATISDEAGCRADWATSDDDARCGANWACGAAARFASISEPSTPSGKASRVGLEWRSTPNAKVGNRRTDDATSAFESARRDQRPELAPWLLRKT